MRRPFCAALFRYLLPAIFSSVKSALGLDFLFAGLIKRSPSVSFNTGGLACYAILIVKLIFFLENRKQNNRRGAENGEGDTAGCKKCCACIAGFRQAIPARVHHTDRHNGGSRTVIVVHVFGIAVFKRFGSQLALSAGAADLAGLFRTDLHGDEIAEQRVICIRVDLRYAVDVVSKTF